MKRNEAIFFVYGTLKANHGNHRCLGNNPEFLGEHTTDAKYTLFDGGYPVVERGGDTSIKGELYKVTNSEDISCVFGLEGCSQISGPHNDFYDFEELETKQGKAIIFVMDKGRSGRKIILQNGKWQ